jgi:hypothetical protein
MTDLTELLATRRFELWAYTVSLGRLLLRNFRLPDGSLAGTNVDLLFVGVSYIELPVALQGIAIASADDADSRAVETRMGRSVTSRERVFRIGSEGHEYFVVATSWTVSENELDRMDSGLRNSPPS